MKKFICRMLLFFSIVSVLTGCAAIPAGNTEPDSAETTKTTTQAVTEATTAATTETAEAIELATWETRDPNAVAVMSFNILTSAKAPIDTVQRNGMTRSESLESLMQDCMPDSIGLCEVTPDWLSYLQERLCTALPYSIAGLTSTRGLDLLASSGECNPILYRSDKYTIVEEGGYWFSETPDEPSKYGPLFAEDGSQYTEMYFNRAFSYAVFQDNSTGEIAYIHMNTHFDHMSDSHVDLLCAQQMKEGADLLQEKYSCPVVMTGDFNEGEGDLAYQYLADATNGYANAKYKTDDFSPLTSQGGFGLSYKPGTIYVIDHIFVSLEGLTVVKHDIFEVPFISDHSPVYVELLLD